MSITREDVEKAIAEVNGDQYLADELAAGNGPLMNLVTMYLNANDYEVSDFEEDNPVHSGKVVNLYDLLRWTVGEGLLRAGTRPASPRVKDTDTLPSSVQTDRAVQGSTGEAKKFA